MRYLWILLFLGITVFAEELSQKELVKLGEPQRKSITDKMRASPAYKTRNSWFFAKLREYDNMKGKYIPYLTFGEGSVGKFVQATFTEDYRDIQLVKVEVFQVLDEENVIIKYNKNYEIRMTNSGRIWREIESESQNCYESGVIWLTGTNTKGLTDGKEINLSGVYKFVGTKRYRTAIGGSKTINMITEVTVIKP